MKLKRLYHTVRHLKLTQVIHQIKYRLVKVKALSHYASFNSLSKSQPLSFTTILPALMSWDGKNSFEFLNKRVTFESDVDWNYDKLGKLWNYNLQYANYVHQTDIEPNRKLELMQSQYKSLWDGTLLLEPYPVSLRVMNMIRWLSSNSEYSSDFDTFLHAELSFLERRLEYHLLGNHLLENAFALLMGGAYFGHRPWTEKAKEILQKELREQILGDGGHFELSPMYHQIILFRVLEAIDWYSKWKFRSEPFEKFLRNSARNMCGWLEQITFRNGEIPHFNDSSDKIAFSTEWLLDYASACGIRSSKIRLGDSGYRSIKRTKYEVKVDVGQVGPSYQPGHAHADALSFILHVSNMPVLVEHGTSTYEIGRRRDLERSTEAHNTVVVADQSQSDVWGGFRVGRRATVQLKVDDEDIIQASHNGYRGRCNMHSRTFRFHEEQIVIIDELSNDVRASAYFHLHPNIHIEKKEGSAILLNNGVSLDFDSNRFEIQRYSMATGYNLYEEGLRLKVQFNRSLNTVIKIN